MPYFQVEANQTVITEAEAAGVASAEVAADSVGVEAAVDMMGEWTSSRISVRLRKKIRLPSHRSSRCFCAND